MRNSLIIYIVELSIRRHKINLSITNITYKVNKNLKSIGHIILSSLVFI
jgi:sorbitol-specific phosphotransferase system component IIA